MRKVNELDKEQREKERQRKRTAAVVEKLKAGWQKAIGKLPESERADLLAQQADADFIFWLLDQEQDLDSAYYEIKDFTDRTGFVEDWIPYACVGSVTDEAWNKLDDRPFAEFGVRTRVPHLFWSGFLSRLVAWAKDNPECDADVVQEAEAFIAEEKRALDLRLRTTTPTQLVREIIAFQMETK